MVDWWQVGFEFAAVLVGVIAGFEFDRYRERRNRTQQAIEFLDLTKKELEGNLETLQNVTKYLKSQAYMPTYGLRLDSWRAFSNRVALVKDPTLVRDIFATYYKFDMYERTMTRYLDLCYTLLVEPKVSQREEALNSNITNLRGTIVAQLDPSPDGILEFVPMVIRNIDAELKKLRDC
jgi:hypothetical protein